MCEAKNDNVSCGFYIYRRIIYDNINSKHKRAT